MVKRGCAIVVYLLLGALAFHRIEYRDDTSIIQSTNHRLAALRVHLQVSRNVTAIELDTFEELVRQSEHNVEKEDNTWNYYQSLYFASTVTTTIGYGHITPQTQLGRVFLMVFAVIGIPLNILALASVGEHITIGIFYVIQYLSTKLFRNRVVKHISIKVMLISVAMKCLMLFLGGWLYDATEDWTYVDSVYYCFVALATIGFGDMVPNCGKAPDTAREKVLWFVRVLYISIGLSLVSTVFTALSNAMEEIQAIVACLRTRLPGARRRHRKKSGTSGMAHLIDSTEVTQSPSHSSDQSRDTSNASRLEQISDAVGEETSATTNPPVIVISHPLTGKPLTYVMASFQDEDEATFDNNNGRYSPHIDGGYGNERGARLGFIKYIASKCRNKDKQQQRQYQVNIGAKE